MVVLIPLFSLFFLQFPLLTLTSSSDDNFLQSAFVREEPPQRRNARPDSLKTGDPAPTFVMRDVVTGEPVYLRDFTGKVLREEGNKNKVRQVVVLSFWATWCQPCKQEIPRLMKIANDFKNKPVKFFLIDSQEQATEDSVRTVLASRGYTLQCLVDASGRFSDKYSVLSLPVLVVIDKYGIVQKVNRGYHENFDVEVSRLLNNLVTQ